MKIFIQFIFILTFCLGAHTDPTIPPQKILYIFPEPGAQKVTRHATLIFKFNSDRIRDAINIAVTGSLSGDMDGKNIYPRDTRILIFKPEKNFEAGETVTVTLSGAVDYMYQFNILTNMVEIPVLTSFDETVPLQKIQYSDAVSEQVTTINGITVPGDFPKIKIQTTGETAEGKLFFGSTFGSLGNYIVILNKDGTPYFYRKFHNFSPGSGEFKLQPTDVLTFFLYEPRFYLVLDHNYNVVDTLKCQHGYRTDPHELLLLPNGNSMFIAIDYQNIDMSQIVEGGRQDAIVIGNHIQELDKDRNVVFEWRSWDHYNIKDAVHTNLKENSIDYVHMNSLAIDYDGNIIASCRHLSEVTKINHETGKIIWRLGGEHNQFNFINDERQISYQHHVRPVPGKPDHYTIFDNGNYHRPQYTRAVEYRLNTVSMTAEKVWEFRYQPDRYSFMLGNVQRLPNNNTLINWSTWGPLMVCEVSEDNLIIEEITAENVSSNRVRRYQWQGMLQEPYLLAEKRNNGIILIFNKFGDNNVTKYNIYGDMHPGPSNLLGSTAETSAFITGIENQKDWYFRVTAVNENGIESGYSNEEQVYTNFIPPGENLIKNGDFSLSNRYWVLENRGASVVSGNIDSEGQYWLRIEEGGQEYEDIQLRQENIELARGRNYILEFDAYTDNSGRPFEVKVINGQNPNENYSKIGMSYCTTLRKRFTYFFTMESPSDFRGQLLFNCGQSDADMYLDNISLRQVTALQVEEMEGVTYSNQLMQNFPNPFNAETTITYSLSQSEYVSLILYDLNGRRIKNLVQDFKSAGYHYVRLNGMNLSNGLYFYRLATPTFTQTAKLLLLK